MAANINDKFTSATNGSRPSPTTLTAIHTGGDTTMTCNALTGWPTDTAVHFIIYTTDTDGNKVAGSQTDWKGVVSGSTITNCVLKAGTDSGYSIGAIVECAPTAAWADDLTDGIRVEHDQDGTHGAITAASVTSAGAISGTTGTFTSDITEKGSTLSTIRDEYGYDYVASGGVWTGDSYGSTLAASMTALVCYINGQRGTISSVTARAFTASKDTYVDVLNDAGSFSLVYTEVANNAASPALASNSIRIAIIVSGGSSIAAATSVNQGTLASNLPSVSSSILYVSDSLGNIICPRTPRPVILGYRTASFSAPGSPGTGADITGTALAVIVPAGRNLRLSCRVNAGQVSSTSDYRLIAHLRESSADMGILGEMFGNGTVAHTNNAQINGSLIISPTSGLHTYSIRVTLSTTNLTGGSAQIWAELI